MKTYTYHTAHKVLLGDLHTPVSTYLKVRDLFPQSALMESSDYHGSENNRSFIAFNPIASISINHGTATMNFPDDTCVEKELGTNFTVEDAIYNPQIEMFARFKMKSSFHKTKRII